MRQPVEATIFPKRPVAVAGRLYRIFFSLRITGLAATISSSEWTSTVLSMTLGLAASQYPIGPRPLPAARVPPTPTEFPPSLRPVRCYSTFSGGSPSSTYNFESSAYAEDRWLIGDRLLVEPGVRLDWDEVIRTPLVSPRLAGTYVLDNSGNTKLSAGIGLIYDPTFLFLIARPLAGQRTDYFFNPAGMLTGTVPTTFSVDRNALVAPRFINWSLGLERKLPAAIYLKAEFLEKRGSRGFVYNTPNGVQRQLHSRKYAR